MDRSELEDLAALDAAGALDADARPAYLRRLARASSGERAAIAGLYRAAARLASALPPMEPPPGTKAHLLARVAPSPRFFSIRSGEGTWQDSPVPGVRLKLLRLDVARDTAVMLVQIAPGAIYPAHHHSAPEECYVVSGDLDIGGERLAAGDFHHASADTDHGVVTSEHGAELLLVVAASDYLRSS